MFPHDASFFIVDIAVNGNCCKNFLVVLGYFFYLIHSVGNERDLFKPKPFLDDIDDMSISFITYLYPHERTYFVMQYTSL